ncbi:MAG: non-homologous end-joining DNA ligase [Acidobacteriota bacterium]|jgi:bifunctional non-homologous end joining protein LigD
MAEPPGWVEPMLATLTDDRFSDPGWIFERKLDGVRCLAFKRRDRIRLLSRNREDMNGTWPELHDAVARQSGAFILDGEVVAFQGNRTSFSRLQGRLGIHDRGEALGSSIAVYFYLFDVLHLAGQDTRSLPQRRRKALLREALDWDDPLRFTPHRNAAGERYFQEACRKGWEGVLAKRAKAPYHPGRSRDWLKFKCAHGQELVIVGFTPPGGSRVAFGALLLAYHEEGKLRYAGKVGTGFDDRTLKDLRARMERLRRSSSPLDDPVPGADEVRWIRPELVAEIGFTEWTDEHRLRHPRYLGLRTDKAASEVTRERPS